MSLVEESSELHAAVRAFAHAPQLGSSGFEDLALRMARFQAKRSPGYARLVAAAGSSLSSVGEVPPVPVAAFRAARVAVHEPHLDEVCFETSGTTGELTGVHPMRTTATYRDLATLLGRKSLLEVGRCTAVAIAPAPAAPLTSSLAFMMRAFMEEFDGREERWGIGASVLEHACEQATDRGEPLLILATALACARLLEESVTIRAPTGSTLMLTGGFKGQASEISETDLRAMLCRALGLRPARIIGEYGMTELSSQLYERASAPGVFHEPPWLRVIAVDPVTLGPVPDGETGLAEIIDLANVDSAVCIVTDDLVRREDGGVRLLGRRRGAPPRGCSLAVEALARSRA